MWLCRCAAVGVFDMQWRAIIRLVLIALLTVAFIFILSTEEIQLICRVAGASGAGWSGLGNGP